MLLDVAITEQRQQAVLEVMRGLPVSEVARRYGVTRQSVHRWLRRYAASGLGGLADHSSRPAMCPHQMPPALEAHIVELRLAHPGWGRAPSPISWPSRMSSPCRGAPRSTAALCVTASSTRSAGAAASARTTAAGNAAAPWSSGRWTSWAVCAWKTAESSRSSPASTTTRASASRRCSRACHGTSRLRGAAGRPQASRHARPDPHRQRQGVQRSLRAREGRRALRPHLPRERRAPPAHRAAQPDHHWQGRALP